MPSLSAVRRHPKRAEEIISAERVVRMRTETVRLLSVELSRHAVIASPYYNKSATVAEREAYGATDHVCGLIGYVTALGYSSSYTPDECRELYRHAHQRDAITAGTLAAVEAFLMAYEAHNS